MHELRNPKELECGTPDAEEVEAHRFRLCQLALDYGVENVESWWPFDSPVPIRGDTVEGAEWAPIVEAARRAGLLTVPVRQI